MAYLPTLLGVNAIFRGSVARSCSTTMPASCARMTRSCGVIPDSRLAVISTGMFTFTTMWFGLKK